MIRRSIIFGLVGAGSAAGLMAKASAQACPIAADGLSFQIFREPAGDWRWRLKARNGRTIADSAEGYRSKSNALNGIDLVRRSFAAQVDDLTLR